MKMNLANLLAMLVMVLSSLPKEASAATVTLTEAAVPLRANNYRISPDDALQSVPLANFAVKCEDGDTTITVMHAHFRPGGARPATLYLYEGNTLVKSISYRSLTGQVMLDNLDVPLLVNTRNDFQIKADFAAGISASAVQLDIDGIMLKETSSGSPTLIKKSISGAEQHLMPFAAVWKLSGMPTAIATTDKDGSTQSVTASFSLGITPLGGNLLRPETGSFTVMATNLGTGEQLICKPSDVSIVTIPNSDVADGSTATVTVTAMLRESAVTTGGLYQFSIQQIAWSSTAKTGKQSQTWGLEDFKTPSAVTFVKKKTSASAQGQCGSLPGFCIRDAKKKGTVLTLTADAPLGKFRVEGSSDLRTWTRLTTCAVSRVSDNGNGSSRCLITIDGGKLPKPMNPQKAFFRLVSI